MPLINISLKRIPKETLSVRIDAELKDLLDSYCCFIQSGRHHVVAHALRLTFEHDHEFQDWLAGAGRVKIRIIAEDESSRGADTAMIGGSYG